MADAIDVSGYWCVNPECPDYGVRGNGNIFLKERYGNQDHALFQCKICKHCFSETRGTVFFGLNTPYDEVLRTLAMIPEKGSIRGVARATGHDKNTICRWLSIAAEHCREVTNYYLTDLRLTRVQVDEIWSYVKKRRKTCDPMILKRLAMCTR